MGSSRLSEREPGDGVRCATRPSFFVAPCPEDLRGQHEDAVLNTIFVWSRPAPTIALPACADTTWLSLSPARPASGWERVRQTKVRLIGGGLFVPRQSSKAMPSQLPGWLRRQRRLGEAHPHPERCAIAPTLGTLRCRSGRASCPIPVPFDALPRRAASVRRPASPVRQGNRYSVDAALFGRRGDPCPTRTREFWKREDRRSHARAFGRDKANLRPHALPCGCCARSPARSATALPSRTVDLAALRSGSAQSAVVPMKTGQMVDILGAVADRTVWIAVEAALAPKALQDGAPSPQSCFNILARHREPAPP